MIRTRLAFLFCLAVSAIISSPAWSEQQAARMALVVGNASYPDASAPLATTIRDARSLAEELRRTGFEVDLKENLSKAEMQRAIDDFASKIRPGTTALFYFSGYGIQVARQTYLIPVNAQVWVEADVRRDGINLDEAVAEIHRKGAKVKIVIVDAARRNPYERRFRAVPAGLAPIDAPENTLAIFSAAPGKLFNDAAGTNSLFAGELLKEMHVPNIAAEEIFNRVRTGVSRASNNEQIPWVASSLAQPFYFGSSGPVASQGGSGGRSAVKVTAAGVAELTRSVESGVETKITHHASWDRDCNPRNIVVTITGPPNAGTASVKDGSDRISERPVSGSAGACAGRTIAGKQVIYRSNAGFRGSDVVDYEVLLPNGNRRSYQVTIDVH
jgi:hypothetical protein